MKTWQPKNYFEALLPIHILAWLFSLQIIQYPFNEKKIGFSIFYTISTIGVYLIALGFATNYILSLDLYDFKAKVYITLLYVNLFIYLINIILMWLQQKRANKIYMKSMEIDKILATLKSPIDYQGLYQSSWKIVVFLFISSIITNTISTFWVNDNVEWYTSIYIVFVVQHSLHANSVILVEVCMAIEVMECRFKQVNKVLLDIIEWKKNEYKTKIDHELSITPITIVINKARFIKSTTRHTTHERLRIAKNIHLELSVLCNEISYIYGIQIATGLIMLFSIVTSMTFILYVIVVNDTVREISKVKRVCILILWLVITYLKVYNINRISANTITEWINTGKIINELKIICKNNEYEDEVVQFSLQLLQTRPSFNACGLVTLGYEFFHSFIASVTTYIIILVQMYDTPTL